MEESHRLGNFKRMASLHRVSVDNIESLSEDQAIEVLRNRLNHQIYSQADDWMCPRWVQLEQYRLLDGDDEAQLQPLDGDRASIGGRYCGHQGLADSSGLTTAIPECGSIDIWLEEEGKILFPALLDADDTQLQLLSAQDQVFSWSRITAPIEFTRLIYHSVDKSGREVLVNEIEARNISLDKKTLRFYVAVRPMSPSGFEPIQTIEYSIEKKLVYVDGILALQMEEPPRKSLMTTADNPNLKREIRELTDRSDESYSTARGLATAVFVYEEEIPPAGTKRFRFVSPLEEILKTHNHPNHTMGDYLRDDSVERWFEYSETTTSASFPSPELDAAFAQAKAAVAMSIESLSAEIAAGQTRDFSRSVAAMCRIGAAKRAGDYLISIAENAPLLERLEPDDIIEICNIALLVYTYCHDKEYLMNIKPLLTQIQDMAVELLKPEEPEPSVSLPEDVEDVPQTPSSVDKVQEEPDDWVERLRTEMDQIRDAADSEMDSPVKDSDAGRLEADAFTYAEYMQFACLSSVMTRLLAVSDALDLGEVRELSELLDKCRARADEAADGLRTAGAPLEEAESLTLLGTAFLFGSQEADSEIMKGAIESLHIMDGFVRTTSVDGSSHAGVTATLELAHYYSRMHDGNRVEIILEALQQILSRYQMLPDFVVSTRPLRVTGQRCSPVTSSLLLVLLLDMIGYQDNQDLVILPGVPDEWYTSSTPLVVKDLNLESGMVQIEVGISANQHQIDVRTEYLPQEIEVHVPSSRAMSMVKVYGGGVAGRFENKISPHIRIVPLSDNVVLTFHK